MVKMQVAATNRGTSDFDDDICVINNFRLCRVDYGECQELLLNKFNQVYSLTDRP